MNRNDLHYELHRIWYGLYGRCSQHTHTQLLLSIHITKTRIRYHHWSFIDLYTMKTPDACKRVGAIARTASRWHDCTQIRTNCTKIVPAVVSFRTKSIKWMIKSESKYKTCLLMMNVRQKQPTCTSTWRRGEEKQSRNRRIQKKKIGRHFGWQIVFFLYSATMQCNATQNKKTDLDTKIPYVLNPLSTSNSV